MPTHPISNSDPPNGSWVVISRSVSLASGAFRLLDLLTAIPSSNNTAVTDILKIFIGDHPAQQFECGTQHGGKFKCCGCGIHSDVMGNLAHALHLSWRSLSDQQELVIKGKLGKQVSKSKPFDSLRVAELNKESHARGIYDTDHCKDNFAKNAY